MEETLFSIACPTCERLLAVRSESAIGAILACPKCASMVHVIPPPGWKPKAKAAAAAPGISEKSLPAAPARMKKKAASDASAAGENGRPAEDVSSPALETTPSESLTVPPPILAPPAPAAAETATVAAPYAVAWKWFALVVVPVVGLSLAVATWFVWTAGKSQPVTEPTAEPTPETAATAPPTPEPPQPEAASPRLDRRWLPAGAQAVFCLRMSKLAVEREPRSRGSTRRAGVETRDRESPGRAEPQAPRHPAVDLDHLRSCGLAGSKRPFDRIGGGAGRERIAQGRRGSCSALARRDLPASAEGGLALSLCIRRRAHDSDRPGKTPPRAGRPEGTAVDKPGRRSIAEDGGPGRGNPLPDRLGRRARPVGRRRRR